MFQSGPESTRKNKIIKYFSYEIRMGRFINPYNKKKGPHPFLL